MELESKAKEMASELTLIRQKIKLLLHGTRIDIVQILKTLDVIDGFEIKPKSSTADFKAYEDFVTNYLIDTMELVDASFHSTLCQNCNEVCHENCEIDEVTVIGDSVLQQCWMIKNGSCRQCAGKCSGESHYRAEKTIKKSKTKMQDFLSDITIKYGQASNKTNMYRRKTMSKEDASKILENRLNQKNEETKQLCIKLYQICASADLRQELQIFIDQLNKECIVLKSIHIKKEGATLTGSLNDFFKRMANESDLLVKKLLYATTDDTTKSGETIAGGKRNVQMEKVEEIDQFSGIDDKRLKELLVDELLEAQKVPNLERSSVMKEGSIRFAPIQNRIRMLLHQTRIGIVQILRILDAIDGLETKSKASNTNFKAYEDFMTNYLIDTMELIDASFHSTLCQNCNEVCHEKCEIDEVTVIGDSVLQQCWMIKNGSCRQCASKCSGESHYRAEKTIKKSKTKIQDFLSDITIRHGQASNKTNMYRRKTMSKEDASKILESFLKQKIGGVNQLCSILYRICPDYKFTHELQVLIDQINRECSILSGNNAKKRANTTVSSFNDLHSTMSNNPRLLEKSLEQMSINYPEYLEKTPKDAKENENAKKVEETQESAIVESGVINGISVAELTTYEKTSDSLVLLETIDETAQPKQEILDTSGMTKILIIGETGSGKSTFINYITNYFYNGNLQNLHVAIPSKFHPHVTEKFIHCENDIQNTTQSKTDNCNQYMFCADSKQYLFVDTPGLSDTRGAQQDDKNIAKIVDSVENLGGLTAVIIVVNGAVSRLTINLQNVVTRLRGNLPDIIMNNIIIVLTNVTRYAANFAIDALELNGNVYPYYMQNSAFSQDPTTRTPATLEAIQCDFDRAMNEIRNMMKTIDTFQTKSVTAFKIMKDIRSDIRTLFHKAHLEVTQIQKLQDEIHIFENLVKQCDSHLVTYKDYVEEREIDITEVVDATVSNTLCGQCNQVCHENCQLDESFTVGAQLYNQCWVFRNGYCRQCVGKCSHTAHYYAKKTIKKSKKKIQTILSDIKFKYDQTSEEKNTYQGEITSKEDARKILESALQEKNEEIKQLCLKLRHICAGFDYTQQLHVFIHQLETEETMLRSIEARQQARALIRSLKDLCSRMANDPDLSTKTPVKMNIINTEPSSESLISRSSTNSTKTYPLNNEPSPTCQNSAATVSEPSSEPNTYANDDVLAVIRAINKKKMTMNTSNKKVDRTAKSEINSNENGNDNVEAMEDRTSENKSTDNTKHTPATQMNTQVLESTDIASTDPRTLSLDELIACYNSHKGRPEANLIIFELLQRSLGRSTGPIKTSQDVADFTASTRKYSGLGANELAKEYEILKHRINATIGSDIFKINQVPSHILSEIAVVHMLIQSSSSMESPLSNISSHPTQQFIQMPPNYRTDQPIFSQQVRSSTPMTNNQPYPQNHLNVSDYSNPLDNQSRAQSLIPSQSSQQLLLDSSLDSQHTVESKRRPYISTDPPPTPSPASNRQSPVSDAASLRTNSSRPSLDSQHTVESKRRPYISTDSPPTPSPASNRQSLVSDAMSLRTNSSRPSLDSQHTVESKRRPYISTDPPPTSSPASNRQSPVSDAASLRTNSSRPSLDSEHMVESNRQPYISTDSPQTPSPASNRQSAVSDAISLRTNSSRSSPSKFYTIGGKHNNIDKMPTIRLISTYYDAFARDNHEVTDIYYDELKRRCYGDHPILISEKRELFDEMCRSYQNRTLEDLKQRELCIHQTIDSHLIGGSFTRINSIPKKLIVEAAALSHLISAKSSEVE